MAKEYIIGDMVWWAHADTKHVTKDCPVCFRSRKVTVILGDGEHVETPCDFCGKGYEGPRGYIEEYEWVAAVKQVTIDRKEVHESNGERKIDYYNGQYQTLESNDIFAEKTGADARILEKIAEHEVEVARNIAVRKEYNTKSYSWHVGYHRREIKKAEKSIEWNSKKVTAMKALAKTPVEEEI